MDNNEMIDVSGSDQGTTGCVRILHDILEYKATLVIVLAPLLCSPMLFEGSEQARCAFCVCVMGLYWMFEVMPLAVTALLPTVLFPMLGILTAQQTAAKYLSHVSFLFIGGLVMALAVEKSELHQRIALKVLTVVGSQPKWIMMGFMCVTSFLSMWISNTATTAMMVPIATSVIGQLVAQKRDQKKKGTKEAEIELLEKDHEAQRNGRDILVDSKSSEEWTIEELDTEERSMAKGLLLSIAFAANIGGTGTLTGTPPNLVLVDTFEKRYPSASGLVNYLNWMQYSIPLMLISVLVCWLSLAMIFLGAKDVLLSLNPFGCCKRTPKGHPPDRVATMMKKKYEDLPPMTFSEKSVLGLFVILLGMWIFRDPQVIPGFGILFRKKYYSDATSAMLMAIVLFIFPAELPDFYCWRDNKRQPPRCRAALMDWNTMQHKFPWSVVILLGGGFAMAEGVKQSGLSTTIGNLLFHLEGMNQIALLLLCLLATLFVTNICSNTVTAVIFVQIVANMAEKFGYHPLYFMIPATLVCSYAFLLPVGTPPNAIVFASGLLKVSDMMLAGLGISCMSMLLIIINSNTWAYLVFDLDTFPDWANQTISQ